MPPPDKILRPPDDPGRGRVLAVISRTPTRVQLFARNRTGGGSPAALATGSSTTRLRRAGRSPRELGKPAVPPRRQLPSRAKAAAGATAVHSFLSENRSSARR